MQIFNCHSLYTQILRRMVRERDRLFWGIVFSSIMWLFLSLTDISILYPYWQLHFSFSNLCTWKQSKVWSLRELGPTSIEEIVVLAPLSLQHLLLQTFSLSLLSIEKLSWVSVFHAFMNFTHLMSCFNHVCARIKVFFLNSMLSSQWILGMEKKKACVLC